MYDTALRPALLGSDARTTCHDVQALQLAKSLRTLLINLKTTGGEVATKASAADGAPPVAAIWLSRSSTYAVAVLAVLASG